MSLEPDAYPSPPLPPSGHDPVLLREVLSLLAPAPGKIIVDCTTGRGGHARAIAEKLGSTGQLICLDADPRNGVAMAGAKQKGLQHQHVEGTLQQIEALGFLFFHLIVDSLL